MKINQYKKLNRIWLVLLVVFFTANAKAQTTGVIVLDKQTPSTAVIVTATQQITLKPGFHAVGSETASFNAKIGNSNNLSPILQVAAGSTVTVPSAPSSGQNYILTKTYLQGSDDSPTLNSIQYFDGLGRPTQTVAASITPSGADLIARVGYDEIGRENKKYLPVAVGGNFGLYADDSGLNSGKTALYGADSRPYVEALLEASPLNRPLGQKKAGDEWQSNPAAISYEANAGDILYFSVTSDNKLQKGTNYVASTLYKTVTTDEDGKSAIEYKDKQGHVVMKQNSSDVQTYYVYNDLDQLSYVLPPGFVDGMGGATLFDDSNALLKQFGYEYRYDECGNCNYKRLPGCEPIHMVYDKADRLILSQDGNQRVKSTVQWSVTKYDALGRVLYTGIINRDIAQSEKDTIHNHVITESVGTTNQLGTTGYTCNYFVGEINPLTVNYYDNYSFIPSGSDLAYDKSQEQNGYTAQWANATGLLTGTRIYYMDSSGNSNLTALYYDDDSRVVQSRSTNHLGGYDLAYNKYDFTGKLLRTLKKHKIATTNEVTELYTYTYDNGLRPLTTSYSLNGTTPVTLASNSYDELGRLKEKKRHNGSEAGQYEYNIQNWPTKVKSGSFEENLAYNKDLPNGVSPCYNGNIAYSTWTYNSTTRGYAYQYDGLNRLTSATFRQGSSTLADNSYNESYSYDKMGNVLTLKRKSNNVMVDDLTLHYTNNEKSNQIDWITDACGSQTLYNIKEYQDSSKATSGEFAYDANGNMTKDLDRKIVTIRYNVLNLPDVIQFRNGNQIRNLYDASGKKLGTEYFTQLTNITPLADGQIVAQSYLAGAVDQDGTAYIGNFEYKTLKGNASLTALTRIYNDEGYVEGISNPVYFYYQKDHLGNNREVWLANTNTTVQRTQYYPSGLPWASNYNDNPWLQQHKYNGKEFVEMHGYDTYDYGARGMYPAIMRWGTVDPLAEKYYSISPYAYCGGNSVNRIDPDGMDWFQNNQTGDVVYVSSLGKGAEKEMEKGWEWMGENNMFMSDKDDIANSDQILAAKNGGDIQVKENNPLTHADDEVVTSMLLEGKKATKFMSDRGYEFKPTQQIRDELEFNANIDHDGTKFAIAAISGGQTFITEKSGYVPKGSIEDRIIPTKADNLLYLDNHTVNRFQITYTTNAIKKTLNSLMPYIGYHDFRKPTVYSSPSEYPRNNKYINLFLKTR